MPTSTTHRRPDVVRLISVEPLFHGLCSDRDTASPRRHLHRFDIQGAARLHLAVDQRVDVRDDFRREGRFEPLFFSPSSVGVPAFSSTSAQCSHACQ
jgi:hypothetical protein